MNRANADLVRASFEEIAPISEQAAQIFYDHLFEIAPETRPMFPEDMTEQKKKLMLMLATAVYGLRDFYALLPAIQELGRRHAAYATTEAQYDKVGAALLHTLRVGLGEQFTPKVEAAWTEVYALLSTVMKDAQRKVV